MKHFSKHRTPRRGFSLVELLAVVAIISIMAVLIGVGLSGGNETISLGNGQRVAASIFQSARSIAVLKQTKTRVLIYAQQSSNTDPRKFLRFMGIVYLKEGGNENTPGDWIPANQGTYLPEGVFYMPGGTKPSGLIDATSGDSLRFSSIGNKDSFKFPNPDSSSTEEFYYYGFDANGMSENPGGTFVLNAGRVQSEGGGNVQIAIENQYATAGFAIRRIGGVMLFNDYDEISQL